MPELEAKVLEHLRALPSLQQQEVLNFILFLSQPSEKLRTSDPSEVRSDSFASAARRYVGCLEGGPSDLSTNPEYLSGFGIE